MIPYKYIYFFAVNIFVIVWIFLFFRRKDLRREMLCMSFLICVGGLFSLYFWHTVDWWYPKNLTNSRIGFEDIILTFTNGGIASVLYESLFYKKLSYKTTNKNSNFFLITFITASTVMSICFWVLKYTSFFSSMIAAFFVAVVILLIRKDLFYNAFYSGICMVILALPFYYFIIIFSPNWIDQTYKFHYLSGYRITGIPIEELCFYFAFGFVSGPFYEFWKGYKLKNV